MNADPAAIRQPGGAARDEPDPAVAARVAPSSPLATCACGHDRNHHMVSASPSYSFAGWCAILIGVSWPPKSVSFTCRRCSQTIDKTTNREEIKKLRV